MTIKRFRTPMLLSLCCALALVFVSVLSLPARAQTINVVAFKSEYGVILIDSIKSRAAFDLFETLNVPVQYGFFYQTKIVAPEDKSFRIACTVYGFNHICAVMVYPGKYADLNFDTDEINLNLPPSIAKEYKGVFSKEDKFHFETEDKRLIIDWSTAKGLSIKSVKRIIKKQMT